MKNLAPRPVRQLHSPAAVFIGAVTLVGSLGCNDILGIVAPGVERGGLGDGAGGEDATGGSGGENATTGTTTGQSGAGTAGTGATSGTGNGGNGGATGTTGSTAGTGEPGGSGGEGGSTGPGPTNGGDGGTGSPGPGGNVGDGNGGRENPAGGGTGGTPNGGNGPAGTGGLGGMGGSNAGTGGTIAGAGGLGGAGGSYGLCDNPEQRGGEMVMVQGGTADIGDSDISDAYPLENDVTFEDFCIDRTEVTTANYVQCVSDSGCTAAVTVNGSEDVTSCNAHASLVAQRGNHPVDCVTPAQAIAFCTWANKRLPTEEEWEYAARGTARRKYPWGSTEPDDQGENRANWNNLMPTTAAVGSFPDGDTPSGVHDLAGNVWEYTASLWRGDYGDARPTSGSNYVARGGSVGSINKLWLRTAYRDSSNVPGQRFGFRCAFGPGQGL